MKKLSDSRVHISFSLLSYWHWIFCVLVTGTKLVSYWIGYEGSWLCFTNLTSKRSISTSFFLPLWFRGSDLPETGLGHSQWSKFCNAWKFRNSCNHVCIGYLCYESTANTQNPNHHSKHVSKHYYPRIKYNTGCPELSFPSEFLHFYQRGKKRLV